MLFFDEPASGAPSSKVSRILLAKPCPLPWPAFVPAFGVVPIKDAVVVFVLVVIVLLAVISSNQSFSRLDSDVEFTAKTAIISIR